MMTSLATLTLEVYYRYIPLYKLDAGAGEGRAGQGRIRKTQKPCRPRVQSPQYPVYATPIDGH